MHVPQFFSLTDPDLDKRRKTHPLAADSKKRIRRAGLALVMRRYGEGTT